MEIEQQRQYFHSLSFQERQQLINAMDEETWYYFRYQADITLRPNQILPTFPWRYCFFVGGRGGGKDKLASAHLRNLALQGQKGLMVVAPTYAYLDDPGGMVDSILAEFPPDTAKRVGSTIRIANGNEIALKTTQQNNGYIIGANVSFAWLNELRVCWDNNAEKQLKMFHLFDASIRLPGAQLLITTNPDTTPIFKYLHQLHQEQPTICHEMSCSMFDNEYLDEQTKAVFRKQFEGTRYFNSELGGKLDFSIAGALFTQENINQNRFPDLKAAFGKHRVKFSNPYDYLVRTIIAGDPSFTSNPETSDEFGIMVASRGKDGHFYLLEDASGIMGPDKAATTIQALRAKYANLTQSYIEVIGEKNGLGEYLTYALRTKDPFVEPKLIHISEGKMSRAQPISILADQNKLHLIGSYPKLEDEMISYTGDPKQKSPNRLDALTLAAQELMLEPRNTPIVNYNAPRFR